MPLPRISIRLPDALLGELRARADRDGCDVTDVVLAALRAHLAPEAERDRAQARLRALADIRDRAASAVGQ